MVEVTVNDSSGAEANGTTNLTVKSGWGGPPVIHSFAATPATTEVDHEVSIEVNATPRSATPSFDLTYLYSHLPPGCFSFNQTPLYCIPMTAGSFHLYIIVTDPYGSYNTSETWLNVTGGTSPGNAAPNLWLIYLPVAAVLLAATIAGVYLIRRRPKR